MTVFLGLCDCNDVNWSGDLCNDCSETFYGSNCEPWMMALYMVPNQALDTGYLSGNLRYIYIIHSSAHVIKLVLLLSI